MTEIVVGMRVRVKDAWFDNLESEDAERLRGRLGTVVDTASEWVPGHPKVEVELDLKDGETKIDRCVVWADAEDLEAV